MRIAIIPVETDSYYEKNELINSLAIYDTISIGHLFSGPSMGFLFSGTTVGYLLSYLEQYFPDDLIYPVPDLDFLIKTKPDLVGISAPYSQTFNKASEIAVSIKETLNIPVILGGQHISYLPKSLPLAVDIGVIGEGEETFRDLVSLFKNEGNFHDKKLRKIPGIVFHFKDQKLLTEKRKPIQDIDSIPLSRKFFYQSTAIWLPTVCTGRGSLSKFNSVSDPIRLHSAERMIGDFIDIITFYPDSRYITITDELFLHDIKRLRRFTEIVIETNLTQYFRFNISALPEQLTDEVFYILKYSLDINTLNIMFSSPSFKNRKELKETVIDSEAQSKILEKCYKYSLKTVAHFLLGSPNETKEDMAKNYWFIRQNTMKIYNNFTIKARMLVPFPGTEAWSKAILKKILNDNLRYWEILNENKLTKETPLLNNSCTSEEFSKIIEEYHELNIKPKKLNFSSNDTNTELIEKITKVAETSVEKFIAESRNNGFFNGASELFEIKGYFNLAAPLLQKRVNLSITESLEQLFRTHDIESIGQEELLQINKIVTEFQTYNKNNDVNTLVNTKEIFTLTIPDVLEQIVRNSDVKTVLQITDPLIADLSNILSYEKKEIETLSPKIFNNSRLKLDFEKKYDCIVLIYTLNIVRHPHKVLKYCHHILNEHGNLIITFFNVKNAIFINQLLNLDISELFYTFNKFNHFTYESMTELLIKNNFIPKKIAPVIYPDKFHLSYAQNMIINLLKNHFDIKEEDYTTFTSTYSCRKKSRRGLIR